MKIVSSINIRYITGKLFYKIYNTFTGAGKKEYHNSAQRYAIALNFGRIALNSNWFNLASMLQSNVLWKPFHK